MDPTMTTTLCPILAVPGLYISDRFAARSTPLLIAHGITHILSVVRWEDRPRSTGPEAERVTDTDARENSQRIIHKHIDIDDDPMEDLLSKLNEMLEWIHDALAPPAPTPSCSNQIQDSGRLSSEQVVRDQDARPKPSTETAPNSESRGRVLVHCNQGISRSGSVVVAYIMRYLSLPYAAALATARKSRGLITPNVGFEYQLRMWEGCGFDVFLEAGEEQEREPDNLQGEGSQRQRMKKPEYAVWKNEVEEIYNHQEYRNFQRAREEWIRSVVARLWVLRKNDL
ncbi:protein-tyrosine phosphatase-like protein [Aspergillus heterothallicus]